MEWILYIGIGLLILNFIRIALGNKMVAQENILEGGFRSKYNEISHFIELVYKMPLMHDDGRSFSYGKPIQNLNGEYGKLIIGLKLDLMDRPILFTKFITQSGKNFDGLNVNCESAKEYDDIEKCINISLKKLLDDSGISSEQL